MGCVTKKTQRKTPPIYARMPAHVLINNRMGLLTREIWKSKLAARSVRQVRSADLRASKYTCPHNDAKIHSPGKSSRERT